jgi:hypothetical protein
MIGMQIENSACAMSRAELTARQQIEMYELLCRHFAGVTQTQFEKDLTEKNWVILLRHGERLVGFSTLHVYETIFEGAPVTVVYSGDTIVAPEAWGSPNLARAWIAWVRRLRETYPCGKYYWLLLTSGFRTYRFLPLFWREFHPRFDQAFPADQQRLVDQLAVERFGAQYDATKGVVRFNNPQRLRQELAGVPEGRISNPHVSFFLSHNPGHALGDELVCLAELTDENLTPAGWRMMKPLENETVRRRS